MGIPASGNAVEMRSIDIWRVHDGMFVEHWDELNLLEVFQQGTAVAIRSSVASVRLAACAPISLRAECGRAPRERGSRRGHPISVRCS